MEKKIKLLQKTKISSKLGIKNVFIETDLDGVDIPLYLSKETVKNAETFKMIK